RSKMTDAQWHFAGPTRPRVELYDCKADPTNLKNLADDKDYKETRARLVDALNKHITGTRDLGFIPEGELWRKIGKEPAMSWIRSQPPAGGGVEIPSPHVAAAQVGRKNSDLALQHMESKNASVRYWAVVALGARSRLSSSDRVALESALTDTSPSVRIEAATALAKHGSITSALPVLAQALESKNMADVLHAARNIELLGKKASSLTDAMLATRKRLQGMRPKDIPATVVLPGDLDMAMFIGFSIDAFAKKVGAPSASDGSDAAWIDLFNGRTLDGWTAMTQGNIQAKAIDGEIQLTSKGKNLWFATDRSFRDFELEAEALMPDGTYNSGLAFRCQRGGKKFTGYQCEIDRAKSGMIYAIGRGWVWPKGKEQAATFKKMAGDCFKEGEWNRFRVRCQGDHVQIWVNDVKTADVHDKMFTEGVIAVQHHGKGNVHRFRNIRIRELGNTK
ncbi:MAG: DUF1080 domain-containing protein, partial [Phycisphaerae bacterium]|nr:DUF1080 domain-containing protein [Phycisphaerae bacterium]